MEDARPVRAGERFEDAPDQLGPRDGRQSGRPFRQGARRRNLPRPDDLEHAVPARPARAPQHRLAARDARIAQPFERVELAARPVADDLLAEPVADAHLAVDLEDQLLGGCRQPRKDHGSTVHLQRQAWHLDHEPVARGVGRGKPRAADADTEVAHEDGFRTKSA